MVLVDIKTNEQQLFDSLGKCIDFLQSKGFKADQRTLVKRLDSQLVYHGDKCYTPSFLSAVNHQIQDPVKSSH